MLLCIDSQFKLLAGVPYYGLCCTLSIPTPVINTGIAIKIDTPEDLPALHGLPLEHCNMFKLQL